MSGRDTGRGPCCDPFPDAPCDGRDGRGARRDDGTRRGPAPYSPPRLRSHGGLERLTAAAEGTRNDGAGGFFAFSGAAG